MCDVCDDVCVGGDINGISSLFSHIMYSLQTLHRITLIIMYTTHLLTSCVVISHHTASCTPHTLEHHVFLSNIICTLPSTIIMFTTHLLTSCVVISHHIMSTTSSNIMFIYRISLYQCHSITIFSICHTCTCPRSRCGGIRGL